MSGHRSFCASCGEELTRSESGLVEHSCRFMHDPTSSAVSASSPDREISEKSEVTRLREENAALAAALREIDNHAIHFEIPPSVTTTGGGVCSSCGTSWPCKVRRTTEMAKEILASRDADVRRPLEERISTLEQERDALAAALRHLDDHFHHWESRPTTTTNISPGLCAVCGEIWPCAARRSANDAKRILSARDAAIRKPLEEKLAVVEQERDALAAALDQRREQVSEQLVMIAALEKKKDSMAAALVAAEFILRTHGGPGCICGSPVIDGHSTDCPIMAEVAARDAAQRRAGAREALERRANCYVCGGQGRLHSGISSRECPECGIKAQCGDVVQP